MVNSEDGDSEDEDSEDEDGYRYSLGYYSCDLCIDLLYALIRSKHDALVRSQSVFLMANSNKRKVANITR